MRALAWPQPPRPPPARAEAAVRGEGRLSFPRGGAAPGWSGGVRGVALLSARSALRSWLVRGAALLLIVTPLVLGLTVSGDMSPTGRLRAFLSLSTSFAGFVLALTAVFLPTRLALDLGAGRLTQTVTGPLPRPALVLGWWLGTSLVLALLVCAGYAAIGAGSRISLAMLKPEAQAEARIVLRARRVSKVVPPDPEIFARAAQEQLIQIVREGRLPAEVAPEEALERLTKGAELRSRSIPRGGKRGWVVEDFAGGGDTVTLRFRFAAARATTPLPGKEGVPLRLYVGGERGVETRGVYAPIQRHEVDFPASQVPSEGTLRIGIQNLAGEDVTVILPPEGPELLHPAGGLTGNLARAAWVELSRLAFLAAVGVAGAAVLDAKLAALLVLFVLALGYGQSFLSEALRPGLFGAIDAFVLALLRAVLWVLPDLGRAELSALLGGGELVPDAALRAGLLDVSVRGGLALGAGALGFRARELGAWR